MPGKLKKIPASMIPSPINNTAAKGVNFLVHPKEGGSEAGFLTDSDMSVRRNDSGEKR